MKNFYIKCSVDVFEEEFNEGQSLSAVNFWDRTGIVKGETPMEAVKNFFEKILFYSFEEENAHIDELNGSNVLHYSNYVDNDNCELEADGEEMAKFARGEAKVFSANSYLEVFELVPTNLN